MTMLVNRLGVVAEEPILVDVPAPAVLVLEDVDANVLEELENSFLLGKVFLSVGELRSYP